MHQPRPPSTLWKQGRHIWTIYDKTRIDQKRHQGYQPNRNAGRNHAYKQELSSACVYQERDEDRFPGGKAGLNGNETERYGNGDIAAEQWNCFTRPCAPWLLDFGCCRPGSHVAGHRTEFKESMDAGDHG